MTPPPATPLENGTEARLAEIRAELTAAEVLRQETRLHGVSLQGDLDPALCNILNEVCRLHGRGGVWDPDLARAAVLLPEVELLYQLDDAAGTRGELTERQRAILGTFAPIGVAALAGFGGLSDRHGLPTPPPRTTSRIEDFLDYQQIFQAAVARLAAPDDPTWLEQFRDAVVETRRLAVLIEQLHAETEAVLAPQRAAAAEACWRDLEAALSLPPLDLSRVPVPVLDHPIGVELEVVFNRPLDADSRLAISRALVERLGLAPPDPDVHTEGWTVVDDNSIKEEHPGAARGGAEFVSPIIRTPEDWRGLVRLCHTLTSMGVSVNPSCGTHVHVDGTAFRQGSADGESLVRLLEAYAAAGPATDAFITADRRKSDYYAPRLDEAISLGGKVGTVAQHLRDRLAAIAPDSEADGLLARLANVRNHPTGSEAEEEVFLHRLTGKSGAQVNLAPLLRPSGTVEFRALGGTVDPVALSAWVTHVQTITSSALDTPAPTISTSQTRGPALSPPRRAAALR